MGRIEMSLSLITISHGTHAGSLAFSIELTGSDILRTKEEMEGLLEKLKSARAQYPFVGMVYLSCHELLKEHRIKNMNELCYALRNLNFYLIGVCSPLAVQSWMDIVNYKVVSGQSDEYLQEMIFVFNEHLVDESPEDGLVKFATSHRKVYYNVDKVKDFVKCLELFQKSPQINQYGFYSYTNRRKVGIK